MGRLCMYTPDMSSGTQTKRREFDKGAKGLWPGGGSKSPTTDMRTKDFTGEPERGRCPKALLGHSKGPEGTYTTLKKRGGGVGGKVKRVKM